MYNIVYEYNQIRTTVVKCYTHVKYSILHSMNPKSHNLNLQMYSFQEILGLFHLENQSTLSDQNMKDAKSIVLKMHPDKSRLPSQYFIFYKRAFEILVDFYQNQTKTQQPVPTEKIEYESKGKGIGNGHNRSTNHQIQSVIDNMEKKEFQHKFNQLFEDNMLNTQKILQKQEQHKWFTQDQEDMNQDTNMTGTIHDKFEKIKLKQSSTHLAKYTGVQHVYSSGVNSGNLYEDDDGDGENTSYISSDPFGKLKYDDLRKVHKDQTIFAVSEHDLQKIPQYSSTDHLQTTRSQQNLTPMNKAESTRMLENQEKSWQQQFMKKEYASKIQTMQYEEKSKTVMSHFLHLTNS